MFGACFFIVTEVDADQTNGTRNARDANNVRRQHKCDRGKFGRPPAERLALNIPQRGKGTLHV
jgi:hypothetical protein